MNRTQAFLLAGLPPTARALPSRHAAAHRLKSMSRGVLRFAIASAHVAQREPLLQTARVLPLCLAAGSKLVAAGPPPRFRLRGGGHPFTFELSR